MGAGIVVNALMMVMVVLGLMTVSADPGMADASVPTLFMVQKGVGASFMTPLISLLIILGAVSTAVNMVAAMVKGSAKNRGNQRKLPQSQRSEKEIAAALICCIVDFGIAQFGLLTLIQKAYSLIAYLADPGHPDPLYCPYDRDQDGYEIPGRKPDQVMSGIQTLRDGEVFPHAGEK